MILHIHLGLRLLLMMSLLNSPLVRGTFFKMNQAKVVIFYKVMSSIFCEACAGNLFQDKLSNSQCKRESCAIIKSCHVMHILQR